MTKFLQVLFGIYCLVLSGNALFCQQDSSSLYSLNASKQYARYLYNTRQYIFAAEEWERVVFLAPNDMPAKVYLLESYHKGKQYEASIKRFRQLFPDSMAVPTQIGITYSKSLIRQGHFDAAKNYIEKSPKLSLSTRSYLLMNTELLKHNWPAAQQYFNEFENAAPYDSRIGQYATILSKAQAIRYKKPGIALALSVPVPGLGRAYAGQWFDGITSLLTVGATAYQAARILIVRGNTKSVWGWFMAGLSASFYSVNLYGSYKAAKRYNAKKNREIIRQVETAMHPDF